MWPFRRASRHVPCALLVVCAMMMTGCACQPIASENDSGIPGNDGGCVDCSTGHCVDLNRDPNNCSACGAACFAGFVCRGGLCRGSCGDGGVLCGTTCTDLDTDRDSCGDCSRHCLGPLMQCVMGTCTNVCPSGQLACNNFCVDPQI